MPEHLNFTVYVFPLPEELSSTVHLVPFEVLDTGNFQLIVVITSYIDINFR